MLKRQPYLLLNISIKKSPNSVQNWINLIDLHQKASEIDLCYETIQRAIDTIDPEAVEGKLSDIYIVYSLLLQKEGNIRKCNEILHEASQVPFRMLDDALSVWRRWV